MTDKKTADPYQVLGLALDAAPADIRAAYREQAKVLHPDVPGGDAVAFDILRRSRDVLLHPAWRANYDATGAWPGDEADNATAALLTGLSGIFGSVMHALISAQKDPTGGDMVRAMQNACDATVKDLESRIHQLESSKAHLERMAGRFRMKDLEYPNHMETLIQGQIAGIVTQIEGTKVTLRNVENTGRYLDVVTFAAAPGEA